MLTGMDEKWRKLDNSYNWATDWFEGTGSHKWKAALRFQDQKTRTWSSCHRHKRINEKVKVTSLIEKIIWGPLRYVCRWKSLCGEEFLTEARGREIREDATEDVRAGEGKDERTEHRTKAGLCFMGQRVEEVQQGQIQKRLIPNLHRHLKSNLQGWDCPWSQPLHNS